MKVAFTLQARSDLRKIAMWISADSVSHAEAFVQRLTTKALSLDTHALRYPLVGYGDLRRMPYRAYLIFYRVTDQVEVVRVGHAARDWSSLLDNAD